VNLELHAGEETLSGRLGTGGLSAVGGTCWDEVDVGKERFRFM